MEWKQIDDNPEWWESEIGEYRYSKTRGSWGYRLAGWGTTFVDGFDSAEEADREIVEAFKTTLEEQACLIGYKLVKDGE